MRYGYKKVEDDGVVSWVVYRFDGPVVDTFPDMAEAADSCRDLNMVWESYFEAALAGVALTNLPAKNVVEQARVIATLAVELPFPRADA